MRYRISTLTVIGMLAAGAANGQGLTRAGAEDRTIHRNWPGDGAQNPSVGGGVNWQGKDAVGLAALDPRPASPSVVPVSVLKISGQALKEMRKSDEALRAGDVRGSAEHLEKMMALTPGLAVGHNNLGTRYVALREYDKAIDEFQKAVAVDPKYRLAVDNIAVTLCMQHRYAEAEPAARWALQIQPQAPSSKYLLGSILVSENKPTEEAYELLRSVQDKYPRARMFLASIFVLHGAKERAAGELLEYLKSPLATDNGVAQEWLGRLEKELSTEQSKETRDLD